MGGVEASGRTVEEAVAMALDELGVERDGVEVEVLAEAGRGTEARVRVWRIGERDDSATDGEGDGEAPAAGEGEDGEYIEDEAEIAAQALDKLLAMMGVRADVSIRDAETPGDGLGMAKAVLDIEGDDLGLLIGRRGETLTALQYLLNLMMTRQFGEHMYFTVDVEGYRRRRERQLMQLAHRMADQVRRTRRPVTLEAMPANERRIIHLALSEDRQVETASFGEGEARKVSISPRR